MLLSPYFINCFWCISNYGIFHYKDIITSDNWSFPAYQSIPGWRHFDLISNEKEKSRKFKSTKAGIIDLEMYLNNAGEVKIEVFENNSRKPNWEKKKNVALLKSKT